MKKFLTSLFAGVLLLSPALLSAATFEGAMRMKMTNAGSDKSMEMDYLIKNNRTRVTPQMGGQKGGGMAMIMDYDKMEIITLMLEQKMYMTSSIKTAIEEATAKQTTDDKFEFTKTGVKEKILGYTCEKYLMKSSTANTEMWLTEELGSFKGFGNGGGMGGARGARGASSPQAQAWEKALAGKNLFPLRVVGLDAGGKENFRMEVAAIEKKSLPESDFVPPADFKKFEMPPMNDMMKGMMKGMIPGSH